MGKRAPAKAAARESQGERGERARKVKPETEAWERREQAGDRGMGEEEEEEGACYRP
jgi:hypothetical protein